MIFDSFSTSALNFSKSWKNGWNKINKLSLFDKYLTIFWFLGPLIYLIERDPADLWLTLISICFLFRCIKNHDWYWANQFWFKSALALWLFGLLSAITSPDPFFSFQQGFVWIRFPLYAAAAQVWLAKDRDIRIFMLISILVGMLIMCIILITEAIIEPKTRLTWPYGDLVPGGYIVKVSLPLFCVLVAIAVSYKNKVGFLSGIIALLTIVVSVLTGERTNFILRACAGILSSLIWKPKIRMLSILILIEILAVVFVMNVRPDLKKSFGEKFIEHIPLPWAENVNEKQHWGSWRGGLQQGLITPIKGIGPSGTRYTCKNLDTNLPAWLPGKIIVATILIIIIFNCLQKLGSLDY